MSDEIFLMTRVKPTKWHSLGELEDRLRFFQDVQFTQADVEELLQRIEETEPLEEHGGQGREFTEEAI